MAISIIREENPYRLISDGCGHYAVIEARSGRVYSLHGAARHEADDSVDGMEVVGATRHPPAAASRPCVGARTVEAKSYGNQLGLNCRYGEYHASRVISSLGPRPGPVWLSACIPVVVLAERRSARCGLYLELAGLNILFYLGCSSI